MVLGEQLRRWGSSSNSCQRCSATIALAAIPVILHAAAQKLAAELLDVVFCDWNLRPRMEVHLHDIGRPSDLQNGNVAKEERLELQWISRGRNTVP
jgi:hypothetical protein